MIPKALQLLLVVGETIMIPLTGKPRNPGKMKLTPGFGTMGPKGEGTKPSLSLQPSRPHLVPHIENNISSKRKPVRDYNPLTNKFLACSLIIPTNFPCNTLILPEKEKGQGVVYGT